MTTLVIFENDTSTSDKRCTFAFREATCTEVLCTDLSLALKRKLKNTVMFYNGATEYYV